MATSTFNKNGMIHLPVEIQRKFHLQAGDKVSFIDTGNGVMVVPIKDLFDLIDPDQKELADEAVVELIEEHKAEARSRDR